MAIDYDKDYKGAAFMDIRFNITSVVADRNKINNKATEEKTYFAMHRASKHSHALKNCFENWNIVAKINKFFKKKKL